MATPEKPDPPDVMSLAFRPHAFGDGGSPVTQAAALASAQAPAVDSAEPDGLVARRVLVLAPVGRDATLAVEALTAAGMNAVASESAPELLRCVAQEIGRAGPPELGALLVTDDALGIDWSSRLADVLEQQPPWSDLPIVMLANPQAADEQPWLPPPRSGVAARLTARGSVTVLDRPVRVAALVSAVTAALHARSRQVEVRELIESRDRALVEAERANRAKSAFLALMSHELRTPLNAIAGYVQLIGHGIYGPINDKQQEALGRVERAEQHLLAIINDLLDFARIESGRIEYHSEPVPLNAAVQEAVGMIEGQLATKGLTCALELPPEPVQALADPERVRQILLNLLSNAAKFTPAGGAITIEVHDVAGTDGGRRVRVLVSDTGIGIPEDKLEAIFEPFVQAHRDSFAESQQGTGLGLPISRQLARAMGGDLVASSSPGVGSTFTLLLPLA